MGNRFFKNQKDEWDEETQKNFQKWKQCIQEKKEGISIDHKNKNLEELHPTIRFQILNQCVEEEDKWIISHLHNRGRIYAFSNYLRSHYSQGPSFYNEDEMQ